MSVGSQVLWTLAICITWSSYLRLVPIGLFFRVRQWSNGASSSPVFRQITEKASDIYGLMTYARFLFLCDREECILPNSSKKSFLRYKITIYTPYSYIFYHVVVNLYSGSVENLIRSDGYTFQLPSKDSHWFVFLFVKNRCWTSSTRSVDALEFQFISFEALIHTS